MREIKECGIFELKFMLYSLLTFRQNKNEFVYSEESLDDTDRQYQKPCIKGLPGMVFVYCPRGKEKEWKKKLISYLEEEISKQIKRDKLLLKNLNSHL